MNWRPSFAAGNNPVVSYTVSTCVAGSVAQYPCHHSGASPVTISASDYDQQGYAIVSGLSNGKAYSFTVTANTANGSSTSSVPSPVTKPDRTQPKPAWACQDPRCARRPKPCQSRSARASTSKKQPILAYIVSASKSQQVHGLGASTAYSCQ